MVSRAIDLNMRIDESQRESTLGIIKQMMILQSEHTCSNFGETFRKYRRAVAEWIIEICEYFNLDPTTTHAAVAYLDRLQPNERYSRYEWQMLAICCVLIAAKYNECEDDVPSRSILETITEQKITNKIILEYEIFALMKMSWQINAYTPLAFLSGYLALGIDFSDDECIKFPERNSRDIMIKSIVTSYSTLIMLDDKFKQYRASDIAGAIVYLVRQDMNYVPEWREELSDLTMIDPYSNQMYKLIRFIVRRTAKPDIANGVTDSEQSSPINAASSISDANISPVRANNTNVQSEISTPAVSKEDKENLAKVSRVSPVSVVLCSHLEPISL